MGYNGTNPTGNQTGCLKWYAYKYNESTYSLLLDHNPTYNVNYETAISKSTKDTYTSGWNSSVANTARLMSADEINSIAPRTDGTKWDNNNRDTWYFFTTGSSEAATSTNKYGWLFDNMSSCDAYGCYTPYYGTWGYWTITPAGKNENGEDISWFVLYSGSLNYGVKTDGGGAGIRPVISINKNLVEENKQYTKEVTYDSSYGLLPTPFRDGYTFAGWYTVDGTKVDSGAIVNIDKNHEIYAQWTANTYTVTFDYNYNDGDIVYFNPETNSLCDSSTAVSTTGTKTGCMKWYVFGDTADSTTLNLLLDHNTTAKVAWNSSSGITPDTVNAQLATDIETWNLNIKSTARLISATEIHSIAQSNGTSSSSWDVYDYNTAYYFTTGTTSSYDGTTNGQHALGWLFDKTYSCTSYGCYTEDSSTNAYWTSSIANSQSGMEFAWTIYYTGKLYYNNVFKVNYGGVRPVIEIPKTILVNNMNFSKNVPYDSIYGTLPTPTKQGYTFNGWYYNGNKIENTTKSNIANNHSLTASWIANVFDFTTDADSYQALTDMTWEEWIDSEYNKNGYIIEDNRIININCCGEYLVYNNIEVRPTDKIMPVHYNEMDPRSAT